MKGIALLIVVVFALAAAPTVFAAKCLVHGVWYPYDHPKCSGKEPEKAPDLSALSSVPERPLYSTDILYSSPSGSLNTGTRAIVAVIGAALIVLIVLWILLPIAVFGIKERIDTLIRHSENTAKQLENMRQILARNQELIEGANKLPEEQKEQQISDRDERGAAVFKIDEA